MEQIYRNVMLPVGNSLQMGKYRVERYLSSGGFGNTYLVVNTQFEERYAMKEFFMKGINERDDESTTVSVSNKDNHTQFEQQREKFKKEARRLRKLDNKHIVHVHDLFDENGTTYYVMDLIDGQSVSSIMKQTGSPLSEEKAFDIFRQVLEALEVVHKEKIWHLDLKPGNIMLDKQGNAVVIDFGASKQLSANEGYTSTSTALCYTPGYAPSEQIDQNMERIGPWTDLYALGATLYNMVTFNQPPSVSEIIDGNAFNYPNSTSESTQQLIKWMMMPSRQKRPQSVSELHNHFIKRIGKNERLNDEKSDYGGNETEDNTVFYEKKNNVVFDDGNKYVSNINRSRVKLVITFVIAIACLLLLCFGLYNSNKNENQLFQNSIAKPVIAKNMIPESILRDSTLGKNGFVQKLLTQFVAYPNDQIEVVKRYKSGIGVCNYTGPTTYQGAYGLGIAEFQDGRLYIGHFSDDGIMQGEAFFRYENGDTFEGTFYANRFQKGKYTIREDGSYFVGSFKNGQPHKGQWYDKNGNKIN